MSWQKIVWIAVMAAILSGFGYLYFRKIEQLQSLRGRQLEYEKQVEELEAKAAVLAKEIGLMESSFGVEKLGREKMGLARRNEKIFVFDPTPAPTKK